MENEDTTNQPLYARDAEAGDVYEKKKGTPKCVRVIVVCIYLFTVSFAALLLSAYYIFFWKPTMDGHDQDSPERLTACDNNDNIVIPDNLAIQLANRSEVPAELFYTNLYRHLIHSKTIKARKSAAVRESSNLTRLIQLYHQQKEINENDVYVQSELEQLVDASASSASQSSAESTQPPSSASDAMMADEDDGGDDYEQSGNYGLYSNHTTIQLDQDDALQQ